MSKESLLLELKELYIEDPTTQPTAFWKFSKWAELNDMKIIEKHKSFSFVLNDQLVCRYPYERGYISEVDSHLSGLVFANQQNLGSEWHETKFFKLYHTHETLHAAVLPKAFELRNVTESELSEVAQFINDNYEHIRVNESQVKSWTEHSVYNSRLWLWIIEKETNRKAALGIAELDAAIEEGALEWIQVDSAFRGAGLGKVLVNELVSRMAPLARFTTVSGEVDNVTQPERLYRNCGFVGDRIWFVYRQK